MRSCLLLFLAAFLPAAAVRPAEPPVDSMSIGERFHFLTGFGDEGYRQKEPAWGKLIPLYKSYEGAPRYRLPAPRQGALTVDEAIRTRRSERRFRPDPIPLPALAGLLVSADGLTAGGRTERRAAPSGGALYPIETYVVVTGGDSLPDGLYHFQAADSSLALLQEGDFRAALHGAAHEQEAVGSSPVTFLFTARFERSTQKNADRGFRYVYMECGAICENLYLQAAALGLGTVAVGSFNDDALNRFLGVDGRAEAALLMMPVGFPE